MEPSSETAATRPRLAALLAAVGLFSIFVNLLMLTGPLFMLQVYDRVLASRSEATLVSLFALVGMLFAFMGVLDYVRARIAARAGARFQTAVDGPMFHGSLRIGSRAATRDALAVRDFFSAPASLAVFDLPWAPIFLFAIFLFHPALGWLAVSGLLALVVLILVGPVIGLRRAAVARVEAGAADILLTRALAEQGDLRGLGLAAGLAARWQAHRDAALLDELAVADRSGGLRAAGRAFRFFMQSAMLALGAYLVIRGDLSAGAMIAASILLGRALAPVDQAISGWPLFERAWSGWRAIGRRLSEAAAVRQPMTLPSPEPELAVEGLVIVPPGAGRARLIGLEFRVAAGEALGVIGPTGSGKSTLARALVGVWPPRAGRIRLGGAALEQYGDDALARHVGYLPQDVTLFPGTIAENIARMAVVPDAEEVVEAARNARVHDLILRLDNGYDTVIDDAGAGLSGGQRQRVGLARALYGRPQLLVLDEPNSQLDSEGQEALTVAVRAQKASGRAVVIMAHRPSAVAECDRLMILEAGRIKTVGPRDDILRAEIQNRAEITPLMSTSAGP